MEIKKIKKIIELLKENDVTEIEVHEGESSVRISQISQYIRPMESVQHASLVSAQAAPIQQANLATPNLENNGTAKTEDDNLHYVTSPMVGRFFQSPDPSKPAYIKIGDKVKKKDVLCIVEAMKMMNPIEAEVDGIIEVICVSDGDPIEFGQKIIGIKSN